MARDSRDRPLTDEEIEELREGIEAQREEIREDLAAELGGEPKDYEAERYLRTRDNDTGEAVPDGGDD